MIWLCVPLALGVGLLLGVAIGWWIGYDCGMWDAERKGIVEVGE